MQFRELRDALLEEMEEIEQSFLQVRHPGDTRSVLRIVHDAACRCSASRGCGGQASIP